MSKSTLAWFCQLGLKMLWQRNSPPPKKKDPVSPKSGWNFPKHSIKCCYIMGAGENHCITAQIGGVCLWSREAASEKNRVCRRSQHFNWSACYYKTLESFLCGDIHLHFHYACSIFFLSGQFKNLKYHLIFNHITRLERLRDPRKRAV